MAVLPKFDPMVAPRHSICVEETRHQPECHPERSAAFPAERSAPSPVAVHRTGRARQVPLGEHPTGKDLVLGTAEILPFGQNDNAVSW